MKKRTKALEARQKEIEKRNNERAARLEELHRKSAKKRKMMSDSIRTFILQSDSLRVHRPGIFYLSTDGKNKNYKVKKKIKIKMPKSIRLQLNVRHGEVKLAEHTKNINATLSYSRLQAATIDGDKTTIVASYSPVSVQNWNYGQLRTDYSDGVWLREVKNLHLNANSSNVTIDKILKSVYVQNDLGALTIKAVDSNFKDLDITVQNGEVFCNLPSTSYTIYLDGTHSKLTTPASLVLDRSKNQYQVIHKGYYKDKASANAIVITSKYSDVVLEK